MPINFAKQARILPLRLEGESVALRWPTRWTPRCWTTRGCCSSGTSFPVSRWRPVIVDAINGVYDRAVNEAEQLVGEMEAQDLQSLAHELEEPQDLLDTDDEAPIIRLVNSLLFRAAKERASDIHIEPMERELLVRFRIDGVLQEIIKPPKRYQNSIVSRVKIMGQLNIAEKRLPAGRPHPDQDRRPRHRHPRLDHPLHLRRADRDAAPRQEHHPARPGRHRDGPGHDAGDGRGHPPLARHHPGHRPHRLGQDDHAVRGLSRINTPDLNILTVEDPVEYQLQGIGQMAINPKIGLTFAAGLRSFLRQDPDVIMVGEIRDRETAEIAIQASLTGHLVFSTVHTNDAAGAITRLVDMGVEPFLVASSLTAVLAQRLVRRVCRDCREAYQPTDEELKEVGLTPEAVARAGNPPIYRAKGCDGLQAQRLPRPDRHLRAADGGRRHPPAGR